MPYEALLGLSVPLKALQGLMEPLQLILQALELALELPRQVKACLYTSFLQGFPLKAGII
jgi:hypothetical protein|tara:strand:- start:231 stop:410 length:180 start_codon:yes stop_codon:yes gene_type:complete